MGRMSSTRIHLKVDQKVRKGQDLLWITIWSENVVKKGQKEPRDLFEFRSALVENSQNYNKRDMPLVNCINAILAAYPNKPIIGEIYPAGYKYTKLFFRIVVPF